MKYIKLFTIVLLIFIISLIIITIIYFKYNLYGELFKLKNTKIDVVYTWVNNTKNHKIIRKEYENIQKIELDNTEKRYINNDEIKYSIRSIYKYASWVNCIYIVISNDEQVPNWLIENKNLVSNENKLLIPIKIIHHSLIYKKEFKKDLPTFNSQSIELHLHKIPGLSEKFIYFNDDCMLGNYCIPDDFFNNNGYPLYIFRGKIPINKNKGNNQHRNAWVNNSLILDKLFPETKSNFTIRDKPAHHGTPLLKTQCYKLSNNKIVKPYIINTSQSKFRNRTNIFFIGLVVYWTIYINKGFYGFRSHYYCQLIELSTLLHDLNYILLSKPQQICLNDNIDNEKNRNKIFDIVKQFYESYFNKPCIYEKIY
jgi:hypothetical protein